jgi:hypothetical protein
MEEPKKLSPVDRTGKKILTASGSSNLKIQLLLIKSTAATWVFSGKGHPVLI